MLADSLQDGFLAFGQFFQLVVLIADLTNANLVETSRAFLSVTRNEGNGGAFVEKRNRVGNSPFA